MRLGVLTKWRPAALPLMMVIFLVNNKLVNRRSKSSSFCSDRPPELPPHYMMMNPCRDSPGRYPI